MLRYETDFPTAENPLDEGGSWRLGKREGTDWNNPKILAAGECVASTLMPIDGSDRYGDDIGIIATSIFAFPADQHAKVVVYKVSGYSGTQHEVEVLLRFSVAANDAHGYEVLWGNPGYLSLVRWNGPLGNYTPLYETDTGDVPVPANGDTLEAQIVGDLVSVWINSTLVLDSFDVSAFDGVAFDSGQPGLGIWPVTGSAIANSLGFSHFEAGDFEDDEEINGVLNKTLGSFTLSATGKSSDINGALAKTLDAYILSSTGVLEGGGSVSTDPFTRADAGSLGANWSDPSFAFAVSSNHCVVNTTGMAKYIGAASSDAQYSQVKVVTAGTVSDSGCGPVIQWYPGISDTGDGFLFQCNTEESRLYRRVNGNVYTQLGSDGPGIDNGDILSIENDGLGNLICRINTVSVITATDASFLLQSGQPGLWGAGDAVVMDDFEGGNGTPGVTGITGVLAKTLSAFTLAAVGKVDLKGVLAKTLGAFTLTSVSNVTLNGALAKTLGAFTVASTGVGVTTGVLAATLNPFTVASVANVTLVGTLAKTLGPFTLTGVSSTAFNGALSTTLAPFTLAGLGALPIVGTASKTLDAFLLASAGNGAGINGTLAVTLGSFTLASAGNVTLNGALSKTLGAFTLASVSSLNVAGTLAKSLDPFTLAGTGVGASGASGTLAVTLGDFTVASSGQLALNGVSSSQLGPFSLISVGADNSIHGALSVALESFQLQANGQIALKGVTNVQLANFLLSSAGALTLNGSLTSMLNPFTLNSFGTGADVTGISGVRIEILGTYSYTFPLLGIR